MKKLNTFAALWMLLWITPGFAQEKIMIVVSASTHYSTNGLDNDKLFLPTPIKNLAAINVPENYVYPEQIPEFNSKGASIGGMIGFKKNNYFGLIELGYREDRYHHFMDYYNKTQINAPNNRIDEKTTGQFFFISYGISKAYYLAPENKLMICPKINFNEEFTFFESHFSYINPTYTQSEMKYGLKSIFQASVGLNINFLLVKNFGIGLEFNNLFYGQIGTNLNHDFDKKFKKIGNANSMKPRVSLTYTIFAKFKKKEKPQS